MYQVIVFIHVLTAIAWMGSLLFVYGVIVPFIKHPQHGRMAGPLTEWVSRRFRRMSQVSLVVLVVTGALSASFRGVTWARVFSGEAWVGPFGTALAWKIGLVTLMTALSLSADFLIVPYLKRNHQLPEKAEILSFWNRYLDWMGHFNVLTAFAIVALAIVLVRGWPL